MRWLRRARVAVAVVGIASAVVIYRAVGRRPPPQAPVVVERLDPAASLESRGAVLQQVEGAEETFELMHERAVTYADGSTRQYGVRISVRRRGGRDYVVTAAEAAAGKEQRALELSGDVKVTASDGFSLATGKATFDRDAGIVRAPDAVSFAKGRMAGSGVGMTYDQNTEVLQILADPNVRWVESESSTDAQFTADMATFDRTQDFLRLEGQSRVVRGTGAFESDVTTAHLSADEQVITFVELRGQSRVSGGDSTLDTMTARDINLVYAEDGEQLERVALSGDGVVRLKPEGTAAGRTMGGDALDLVLAPDGRLTQASGRGGVRLEMPGTAARAGRVIRAQSFEATGAPGRGLTGARFVEAVEYSEEGANANGRAARARTLDLELEGDVVRDAAFSGAVTFEEPGGLRARAATMRYAPAAGTLQLSGADAGGTPRVADERIAIDAQAIDVGLDDRRMRARGGVKTTLTTPQGGDAPREAGLLDRNRPVNVNADTLAYDGMAESAVYTGDATLWQGETAIRANAITLDQRGGGLVATGGARSTMTLDGAAAVGRAAEIRYVSDERLVRYSGRDVSPTDRRGGPPAPVAPARGAGGPAARGAAQARGGAAVPAPPLDDPLAQLSGTHGDLRAARIEVVLGIARGAVARVEAYRQVSTVLQARKATGDRLTYYTADERYVLSGTTGVPVSVVDACRAITGKTLTFFRSTDRIVVDGDRELRTRTAGGPCQPPVARP